MTWIGKRARVWYGMTLGAGLMYFLDPETGTARRAHAEQKIRGLLNRAEREVEQQFRHADEAGTARDLGDRAAPTAVAPEPLRAAAGPRSSW
jgi:hypothetical protein